MTGVILVKNLDRLHIHFRILQKHREKALKISGNAFDGCGFKHFPVVLQLSRYCPAGLNTGEFEFERTEANVLLDYRERHITRCVKFLTLFEIKSD